MTRPLRVGMNLLFASPSAGGAKRYAEELLRAMLAVEPETEVTAFVSAEAPEELLAIEPVRWIRHGVSHGGAWSSARALFAQWGTQPWHAARMRLDVVHGLANVAPLVLPRAKRVVTVLDLIWLRHKGSMSAKDTLAMRATAIPSARRAHRVIAISETAKRDLVETLGLPEDRIDVTLLGVNMDGPAAPAPEALLRAALDLGDAPVILCVAQKRSHKNLEALVQALPLLRNEQAILVLPGAPTPYEARLKSLALQLAVSDRLRTPAWMSESELEGLYALASIFALPSLEEGFGLPMLEAMRRGVPVACSDASSLPEVAGGAAELFDPLDHRDVARALDLLLGSMARREELIGLGRARCRELTWERTARATLDCYRRALRA